jgi:hypothetical protein
MIQTVKRSGDPELDDQLYSATLKEVKKGFLVGPKNPNVLMSYHQGPLWPGVSASNRRVKPDHRRL